MRHRNLFHRAGFTLLELTISVSLIVVMGVAVAAYFYSSTSLYIRNSSINQSHDSLRRTLDRLADTLQTAKEVPVLINTSGGTVTSGSAAGLRYDRFIAEPYVLGPAATATTISSTATSLQVIKSLDGNAPPDPSVGDILLIDTTAGTIRGQIKSVVSTSVDLQKKLQYFTLTFNSSLGRTVSWIKDEYKQAQLVRHEAFIVMPKGGRMQLRYYPIFEPMPALNNPGSYVEITDQLEPTTANATPFSMVDPARINLERMVQVNLRIRARQYDQWLSAKQKGGFNSFMAINMRLPSRFPARTQELD